MNHKVKTIVISFDGLGTPDWEIMLNKPAFKAFMKHAAYCSTVKTVYPSMTYAAHTSIATGLYPAHHGVVNNTRLQPLFLNHPELQNSPAIGDIYARMRANPKNFDPRNYLQCIIDTVTTGSISNTDVEKIVACMKDGVMEAIAPLLVQFGSYRKSELIQPVTLEQMADRYKKEGI